MDVNKSKIIDPENEDPEFFGEFMRTIDDPSLQHSDNQFMTEIDGDNYMGMEVAMPRGDDGERLHATVKCRVIDEEGRPIGRPHTYPLLDSRKYEVEFVDGYSEELTANIIAENLIAQVDDEGCRQMMMSEIIDHRVLPDAIPRSKGTYKNSYGVTRKKFTTRGWQLLVKWKDGSTDWVERKDLKESYPVELALCATHHSIAEEPAFE
jgi:hypothetical protein